MVAYVLLPTGCFMCVGVGVVGLSRDPCPGLVFVLLLILALSACSGLDRLSAASFTKDCGCVLCLLACLRYAWLIFLVFHVTTL